MKRQRAGWRTCWEHGYIQFKLYNLEKEMLHYLVATNHYKESDTLEIKAKYSKMPTYSVDAVFKDEPNVTYNYTLYDGKEWFQLGPSDGEIEGNQDKYKHIDTKRLQGTE
nr:DUF3139 domain-containing protein [Brevibacillus agri]